MAHAKIYKPSKDGALEEHGLWRLYQSELKNCKFLTNCQLRRRVEGLQRVVDNLYGVSEIEFREREVMLGAALDVAIKRGLIVPKG